MVLAVGPRDRGVGCPGETKPPVTPRLALGSVDNELLGQGVPCVLIDARWDASDGSTSQPAAAAIPGARIHVLNGHRHFAHGTDPDMVASLIEAFDAQ
jgi:hypothetical protein